MARWSHKAEITQPRVHFIAVAIHIQKLNISHPDRSPRRRRRDSPRQPADVAERLAAAQPGADTTPPAAAATPTAAAAAAAPRRRRRAGRAAAAPSSARHGACAVATDGEARLGAVVVRRRLPGERHLQQNGTGRH